MIRNKEKERKKKKKRPSFCLGKKKKGGDYELLMFIGCADIKSCVFVDIKNLSALTVVASPADHTWYMHIFIDQLFFNAESFF